MQRRILGALAAAALLWACGPAEELHDRSSADCAGKCDGLSSLFKDLFSDMKKVDLDDLVNQGATLATGQLNDQLASLPYLEIRLSPTEVYATSSKAKQDLTLRDIDQLTAGLAVQYGDGDFVTRVNKLRADYLGAHPKAVFAESRFSVGGKLNPSLGFDAGGVPGHLGLSASKTIETTVIAPYEGELTSLVAGPVKAIKAARGFVLPREVQDIEQMVAGETVTLSSDGTVGLLLGLGLPIYITTIADHAALHAVISAAAQATLTGKLDIQLIRGQGSVAIVDVGLTGQTSRFLKLAAQTAWGLEGLPHVKLKVGALNLDVAELAEKALEELLDRKLDVSAAYINEKQTIRHTVARFAFDLSRRDQALDQALIQALMGDIRLAQALAHRQGGGVTQELDLTRDARSVSSYLGLHFLSMRFFSEKKNLTGSTVITVGPSSQQLLFDELVRQSGAFWGTEGYRRRTVVSLRSQDGKLVDADFNLHVQLRESAKFSNGAGALKHADPLLAFFVGRQGVVDKLQPRIRSLQSYIRQACPRPDGEGPGAWQAELKHEACVQKLASDPGLAQRRQQVREAFTQLLSQGIRGGLDPSYDDAETFAREMLELKLALEGDIERLTGGGKTDRVKLVLDYRLTDKAITTLLAAPDATDQVLDAVHDVLALYDPEYEGPLPPKPTDTWSFGGDNDAPRPRKDVLRQIFDTLRPELNKRVARYRRYVNLAAVSYDSQALGHTRLGNEAHLLVVNGNNDYDLATVAEGKAGQATQLFDNLVGKVKHLPNIFQQAHQVIGHGLLSCMHPSQSELLVNFDFGGDLPPGDVQLYGRGKDARLIDAGQYSLDALIGK